MRGEAMIVQCADCKTSFRLQAELVPPREIQVRCARCGSVFAIDGRNAGTSPAPEKPAAISDPAQFNNIALDKPGPPSAARQAAPPPAARQAAPPPAAKQAAPPPAAPQPAAAAVTPPAPEPVRAAPSMDFEIERSAAPARGQAQPAGAVATEAPPEGKSATFRELDLEGKPKAEAEAAPALDPETEKQQAKARRLARALVSDILVYNRESRDSALKSGNLVQVLGPEIKKSWEVYKDRVTPELANDNDFFRDALNEILAEGQPIF